MATRLTIAGEQRERIAADQKLQAQIDTLLNEQRLLWAAHDQLEKRLVAIESPPNPEPTPTPMIVEAAIKYGWGPVMAGDEFNYSGPPDPLKWGVYNGPGHNGKGLRRPSAWNVDGTICTVSGDANGTTGGMAHKFSQLYGGYGVRMKTNARDPQYHPVDLLWPSGTNSSPRCWEIDFAEGGSNTSVVDFFLHYTCQHPYQTHARRTIDTTQWHIYEVAWTPTAVVGFIDGVEWFRDTDPAHIPNVKMHACLQLDWFPNGTPTKPSQMMVDWLRVYGPEPVIASLAK